MLISEYQVREYGLVIDSTSKRHKAPNGQYGTQRFNISEDVHIPFVDRGGLMGFEVLHWEKDAVEKYEVFEITQDSPWRPQVFMELEDPQPANLAYSASDIAQIMSGDMGGTSSGQGEAKNNDLDQFFDCIEPKEPELFFFDPINHYDPSDLEIESFGHPVNLAWHLESFQDTLQSLSYDELTGKEGVSSQFLSQQVPPPLHLCSPSLHKFTMNTASWHRVIHHKLDPKILQPYLGYAPIDRIKDTLKRSTQLAKMTIRFPLQRHQKSRFSFLRSNKLEETVSTDWKFANCKSIGHGHTGMQVFFGLKSRCINVYGGKSKSEFPDLYRDFIRDHGAPSSLRRDNALEEQSQKVDAIHREL